jgi:hypothetical protein
MDTPRRFHLSSRGTLAAASAVTCNIRTPETQDQPQRILRFLVSIVSWSSATFLSAETCWASWFRHQTGGGSPTRRRDARTGTAWVRIKSSSAKCRLPRARRRRTHDVALPQMQCRGVRAANEHARTCLAGPATVRISNVTKTPTVAGRLTRPPRGTHSDIPGFSKRPANIC